MLKKCISLILVSVMVISVFAVAPFSVQAEEVDAQTVVEEHPDDAEDTASQENDSEAAHRGDKDDLAPVGVTATTNDGFTYSTYDNNATITKYTGSATELTVPEKINGYTVTEIGNNAFSGCTSLESLTLPESLKTLGYRFIENTAISSITIPKNVTSSNTYSYNGPLANCKTLEEVIFENGMTKIPQYICASDNYTSYVSKVVIPESVTTIGYDAFYKCTNIEEIAFPKALKQIEGSAFNGCTSLKKADLAVTSIGESAFANCNSLESISQQYDKKSEAITIGGGAFSNCKSLTTVSLSENLSEIGYNAFSGCTSLESLTLPESLKTLGYRFIENTAISSITIPKNVTSSNTYSYNGPLANCKTLEEVIFENGMTKIPQYICASDNYTSYVSKVVIPESVTTIGYDAFYKCTNIEEIAFPKALKQIEDSAFNGCTSLKKADLAVTSIGESAFANCNSLESISQQYDKKSEAITIGGGAFSNCKSLTTVSLSENLSEIGYNAFSGCTSLESLTLPESLKTLGYRFIENTAISSITIPKNVTSSNTYSYNGPLANCKTLEEVIFENGMTKIPQYICASDNYTSYVSKVVIPESVTTIGYDAFYKCTNIEEIAFPKALKQIEGSAFNGCTSLKKADLAVTSIGESAFANCNSLESISQQYDKKSEAITIGGGAFSNCKSLTTVSLSENLSEIGYNAFSGCTSLESLTLPESLKTLGYRFIENTAISSITIPKNVTSSNTYSYNGPLANCKTLEEVIFENGMTKIPQYICASDNYTSYVSKVVIPESVTTIGYDAFYKCTNIEEIAFPKALKQIEGSAFNGCTSLKKADLAVTSIGESAFANCNSLESISQQYDKKSEAITIGGGAFSNCKSLTTVSLSENLSEIGYNAFSGCTSLESLTLPESLKTLGYRFIENTAISSITIPKNVTSSNTYSYNGPLANCKTLEEVIFENGMTKIPQYICASDNYTSYVSKVVIPESVTTIGYDAFYKCTNIEEIAFPKALKQIEGSAFNGCTSLKKADLAVTSIGESAFANCNSLESISQQYDKKSEAITIGGGAFSNCKSLTTVSLSENLSEIGYNAFSGCTSLESLTLPESLKTLGYRFIENTAISSITIPKNVTSSNTYSYNGPLANCKTLEEVIFENGMTKIPQYICASDDYTSYVSKVVIPESVTMIGNYAFYNCRNLGVIRLPSAITALDNSVFRNCSVSNVLISEEDSPVTLTLIDNELPYTADKIGINDSKTRDLNRDNTYYRTTANSVSAAGVLNLAVNYDFKANVKRSVTDLRIKIKLPSAVNVVYNSVKVDGSVVDFTEEDGGYLYIPVENASGSIHFSVQPNDTTYLLSYAQMEYRLNGTYYTDTIGIVNMATKLLTIDVPDETSDKILHITGVTSAGGEVEIYLDDELIDTVTASAVGNYSSDVLLKKAAQGAVYKVEAKVKNSDDTVTTALDYVTYNKESIKLTRFDMYFRGNKYDLIKLNGTSPIITWAGGSSYSFIIDFNNNQKLDVVKVVSTKGNEVRTIKATYDANKDYYIASGFYGYVPGTISVEYKEKPDLSGVKISEVEEEDSYTLGGANSVNGYLAKLTTPGDDPDLHYYEEYEKNVVLVNTDDLTMHTENGEVYYVSTDNEWYYRDNGIFLGKEFYTKNIDGTYDVYRYGVGMISSDTAPTGGDNDIAPVGALGKKIKEKAKKVATNFVDKEIAQAFDDAGLGGYYGNTKIIMDILNTNVNDARNEDAIAVSLKEMLNNIDETKLDLKDRQKLIEAKTKLNLYTMTHNTANINKYINKYIDQSFSVSDEIFIPGSKTLNNQFRKEMKNRMKDCVDSMADIEYNISDSYLADTIKILTDKSWFSDSFLEKMANQAMDDYDKATVNFKARYSIDPSGYVYEGVTDNRVSGVKATIYYKETEDAEPIVWDAAEYDQLNPLYSDENGDYAWDVPEGYWQVKFEKDGYETAYSEWMTVPPERLDVNIGLVSLSGPSVEMFNAYDEEIQIVFDQYVDVFSVNSSNIVFTSNGETIKGMFEAEDEQLSALDNETKLARTFTFVTNKALNDNVSCTASNIVNYANKAMDTEYRDTIDVVKAITEVTAEEQINVVYGSKSSIEITAAPADAAAGKKLLLKSDNSFIISVPDSVTFDENGTATVPVDTLLIGETAVKYTVEGTTLSGSIDVVATVFIAQETAEPEYEEKPLGDVDGDGTITVIDATFIQRKIAKIEIPFDFNDVVGDADEDGQVTLMDATYIQRWLEKLNSNDNIGKPISK